MRGNDLQGTKAVSLPSQSIGFTKGFGSLPKGKPIDAVAMTNMRSSQFFVGTIPMVVSAASQGRNYLLIQNTGLVDVWLGFGSTPSTSGQGAVLLAAGTSIDFPSGIVPNNEVYAVCAGASSIQILDGTRQQ